MFQLQKRKIKKIHPKSIWVKYSLCAVSMNNCEDGRVVLRKLLILKRILQTLIVFYLHEMRIMYKGASSSVFKPFKSLGSVFLHNIILAPSPLLCYIMFLS